MKRKNVLSRGGEDGSVVKERGTKCEDPRNPH